MKFICIIFTNKSVHSSQVNLTSLITALLTLSASCSLHLHIHKDTVLNKGHKQPLH